MVSANTRKELQNVLPKCNPLRSNIVYPFYRDLYRLGVNKPVLQRSLTSHSIGKFETNFSPHLLYLQHISQFRHLALSNPPSKPCCNNCNICNFATFHTNLKLGIFLCSLHLIGKIGIKTYFAIAEIAAKFALYCSPCPVTTGGRDWGLAFRGRYLLD